MDFSAIPGRVFTLNMNNGRPVLESAINGRPAIVNRAYLEMTVCTHKLPGTVNPVCHWSLLLTMSAACMMKLQEKMLGSKTNWIDLYGFSLDTNEPLHERVPLSH